LAILLGKSRDRTGNVVGTTIHADDFFIKSACFDEKFVVVTITGARPLPIKNLFSGQNASCDEQDHPDIALAVDGLLTSTRLARANGHR
jgi:hypothetical protein